MEKGNNQATLHWLYLLTAQAAGICVFQAILGYMTGSLELQSDLAHSAIDTVTYGLNAATEWMKTYALAVGLRFVQPHLIDEVGSFVSVMILIVMMIFAIGNVMERIKDPETHIQNIINDTRGPAMVCFSLFTLVSNGLMLYLYQTWGLNFTDTSADEESTGLVCAVCDDDEVDESTKEKESRVVRLIHSLLHPGCIGTGCADLEKLQQSDNSMVNLNLGAATLHLFCDALRTITVLVSGLLIDIHLGAAWAIDAYGALLIAAFNILGAGTLGLKALKAFCKNEVVA